MDKVEGSSPLTMEDHRAGLTPSSRWCVITSQKKDTTYTAPWSILHGATTALPLKAGKNTIYYHAPGATTLDAADLDAIDVQAPGHGTAPAAAWPKLVTPVVSGY